MTAQPDYGPPPEYEPPDIGSAEAVSFDFAELTHAITRLSDDVPAALDQDDTTATVVQLLHDLRTQWRELGQIAAYVEAAAVKRLHYGQQQVGDLIAEVRGGKARKEWRNDDLAWAVCRPLAVDESTGEVVPEIAQIIDKVRSRMLLCARQEWRMTPIRDLGLESDDFCLSEPGRKTVTVTPAIAVEP